MNANEDQGLKHSKTSISGDDKDETVDCTRENDTRKRKLLITEVLRKENEQVVSESLSDSNGDQSKNQEDMRNLDPFISFECCICKLNEKCLFGELKASDGYYASPMFFIRDPFAPPTRIRTRKPILSDFLVMGSCCSICSRSVCIDKACCIYFGAFFCADCIVRERRRFPEKVLEMLTKAQHSSDKSETS